MSKSPRPESPEQGLNEDRSCGFWLKESKVRISLPTAAAEGVEAAAAAAATAAAVATLTAVAEEDNPSCGEVEGGCCCCC